MTTKVKKWGNSLAVRIPREMIKECGWREGTLVEFIKMKDGILLRKIESKAIETIGN